MNNFKLIHLTFVLCVFAAGCLFNPQNPFPRPNPREDPKLFKKQEKLHLELARDASKFSKSLAYVHYMLARRHTIIYNAYSRTDMLASLSKINKMEEEIIYPLRAEAIEEARDDLLSSAVYMHGKEFEYSIAVNPNLLIDIADAYENQGKKEVAESFRNQFLKWTDALNETHFKADGYIQFANNYFQKGDLKRSSEMLKKGVGFLTSSDRKYLKPETVVDAAYLSVSIGDQKLASKTFNLLFECFRYREYENPFVELFARIKTKKDFDLVTSLIDEIDDLRAQNMIFTAFTDDLRGRTGEIDLYNYIDEIVKVGQKHPISHENALLLLELAADYHKNGQIEKCNSVIDYVFDPKASGIRVSVFSEYPIEVTNALNKAGRKEKALELVRKKNDDIKTTRNIHEHIVLGLMRNPACYAIMDDEKNTDSALQDVYSYSQKANHDTNNLWSGYIMLSACYRISGNETKAEEMLNKSLDMLKACDPARSDVIRINDEFRFGLKYLYDLDKMKEIVQYLDTKGIDNIYTAELASVFIDNDELDEAYVLIPKTNDNSMRQTVIIKLADSYLHKGNYEKVLDLAKMFNADYQKDERNLLIEKACASAAEKGDFDFAYILLWSDDKPVEEPQRLSSCIIGYLRHNTLSDENRNNLQSKVFNRMRMIEYLDSLTGAKDFALARKAEESLGGFADYIEKSANIDSLRSHIYIAGNIPEKQRAKADKLFDEKKYDECFKLIKYTNEADWVGRIPLGDPIIIEFYRFNDYPEKFASVKRFDLAIKTFRYVDIPKMPQSIRKVNEIMIEEGYSLTDDDWYELRPLIHSDKFFLRYPL